VQIFFRSVFGGKGAGFLLLVSALLAPGIAWPQTQAGMLQIEIAPRGAAVELKGPQTTLTASPNSILRPPTGWYRLEASYPLFEKFSRNVYIDPQSPTTITGTLSPKSRWKAGARSVFFPGWGQYYSERTPRGLAYTLLTAGMAVGYLFFDDDADDQLKQYEEIRKRYDEAQTVAEQEALLPLVESDLQNAYDADHDKLTWGYITLGVYVFQIIDAVVFFPDVPDVRMGQVKLGMTLPNTQTVGLGATYDF
jgi:hypothetical protein